MKCLYGTRPGRFCRAEIQSLDLGADLLAHVWTGTFADEYSQPGTLHVLRRADGRDRRVVYGDISGACGSMAATDAQLRGRVVQYVRRLYNCAHRSSYLHRFDTATGHDTRVNPPPLRRAFGGAHAMASDGRDTYWLHSNHTTDTETSPGTCDRGCRIIRSKGLCFAPRRSQDPRASDGAENSTS